MRAEIIVFLIVFIVSGLAVDWACLIMASRADERAKIAEANLEREREKKKRGLSEDGWMFSQDGTEYIGVNANGNVKEENGSEH